MAIGLPGVPDFGHCSFGKLGDAVQCFSICVHLTRKRHSACEQSNEARKLCPATDSGPIRPILKSVHFTKPPLFTFRLTRTRHSACEQSNEARKLCPAIDIIIDMFLVLFGSVFLVLACYHHLSASSFDFLHFGTLPTLPEHEVRSASRVTATPKKAMFAAATVVPCRFKWRGWLCVL